jgi:hypothetical protein
MAPPFLVLPHRRRIVGRRQQFQPSQLRGRQSGILRASHWTLGDRCDTLTQEVIFRSQWLWRLAVMMTKTRIAIASKQIILRT